MYFSLQRILLMVLVCHFVLPEPEYSVALVRRLIEKLTVYVEVLLIMVKSGLEITVDSTLGQSEMIRLLFLVL